MARFCPLRAFILDLGGGGWGFAGPFYFVQDCRRNLEATGAVEANLRPFSFGRIRRADSLTARGRHLGIFWVGMCRPGLQIGTPF